MKRRVVVSGIGLISPLGCDLESVWQGLCAGRSAIRELDEAEGREFAGRRRIGGIVPEFQPRKYIADVKTIRLMTRAVTFGVAASQLAAANSGIAFQTLDPARLGTFIGSRGHSSDRQELLPAVRASSDGQKFHLDRFGESGMGLVNPMWLLKGLANNVLYFVSLKYNAQGMNNNISMGGAGGTMAIGEAFHAIQRGYLDVAFAGSYDSMLDLDRFEMFDPSGLVSQGTERAERASRPFDRRRDGFVMSEGACFLVLEEAGGARARGAKVYGEVVGYGSAASSNTREFGPSAGGFAAALRAALRDAGLSANGPLTSPDGKRVDAVFAHGLATRSSDIEETRALKTVFGEAAPRVPVTAPKSMLGNTLAASGAIEAAAALLALRDGRLPPTINRDEPDPACDLDYVAGTRARPMRLETIAINNANLGGAHAALVVARPSSHPAA